VNAITWKETGPAAHYDSARVRVTLKPGQIMQIDGAQPHAMGLLCGTDASTLAATAPAELIVAGTVEKDWPPRRLTINVLRRRPPLPGEGVLCWHILRDNHD
jgi:hypothetical protein